MFLISGCQRAFHARYCTYGGFVKKAGARRTAASAMSAINGAWSPVIINNGCGSCGAVTIKRPEVFRRRAAVILTYDQRLRNG